MTEEAEKRIAVAQDSPAESMLRSKEEVREEYVTNWHEWYMELIKEMK